MKSKIIAFFEEHHLDLSKKTIVAGVSTGVDSMVLLHALLGLRGEYDLKIHVAHFNHQKREQSKEEERYIREFCARENLPCHVKKMKETEYDNFQAEARKQRYEFFTEVGAEVGADYLALAHHAGDNIETMLMRIMRGSNLKGYAGMEAVSEFRGRLLVRPLLGILKTEILDYAKTHAIRYYEDCTNDTPAYTRNRIRKEILPALFSEDENVHRKFAEFSKTLLAAWEVVEAQVKSFIQAHCVANSGGIFFELSEFRKLSEFLRIETLFLLLKPYDPSKANVLEIEKIFESEKPNLRVRFLNKFTVLKEYDKAGFLFGTKKDLPAETKITGLGMFRINDDLAAIVSKMSENTLINDDEVCYNSRMLPVLIRSRKPGDKIELEAGSRKVKDLLIDRKIGISQRSQILVLEKDGEILSVLGVRKSAKLKEMKNGDIIIKVVKNNG